MRLLTTFLLLSLCTYYQAACASPNATLMQNLEEQLKITISLLHKCKQQKPSSQTVTALKTVGSETLYILASIITGTCATTLGFALFGGIKELERVLTTKKNGLYTQNEATSSTINVF